MKLLKQMNILLILGIIFTGYSSLAVHCLCLTGVADPIQESFFYTGCNNWFSRMNTQQKCSTMEIKKAEYRDRDLLAPPPGEKIMRIGYVGHWTEQDSVVFIAKFIWPMMQQYNVSVEYDNTACNGTAKADLLQDYINRYITPNLSKGQYLQMRGMQTFSMGLWDQVFGESVSFYAQVGTKQKKAAYPSCSRYENQACIGPDSFIGSPFLGPMFGKDFQSGSVGKCTDTNSKLAALKCQKATDGRYYWFRF